MEKEKIKLVYSQKYNQHYRPIKFDEMNKTCYIIVAKNRKDKSIHRDMIARIEENTDWKFIIMRNEYITAEDNFVRSMNCDGEYMRKMNEIHDFKRNGLMDSEIAVNEVNRLYHSFHGKIKSNEDRKFRKAVSDLYFEIKTDNVPKKNKNFATYAQHVPNKIRNLAQEKGLFIERTDDFCISNGKKVKASNLAKKGIRGTKPCGYLIRNKSGKVIIGAGYKLTDKQVIEFVKKYQPTPNDTIGNYKVPLSKQEEDKLVTCKKILIRNKLNWKNENNIRFWVLDKGKIIYGGKGGVGLKKLFRFCIGLKEK